MTTRTPTPASPPETERPRWALVRRVLAATIIVALAAFVVSSYLSGSPTASCHQELANSGDVVRVCGPIGAGDVIAVGLVALVAAILMWPELSEVGVVGLLTLKRRVDETQAQQHETERRVDETEKQQQAIDDTVRSLALAQAVPDLGSIREELASRLARWSQLPDDVHVVPQGSEVPAALTEKARVITEERADIEEKLRRRVGQMDRLLRILSHEAPERLLRHPYHSRQLRGGAFGRSGGIRVRRPGDTPTIEGV